MTEVAIRAQEKPPSAKNSRSWPEERLAQLRRRAGEGWSAGLIAAELGATRNAVVGQAQRLGVQLRGARRKPPARFVPAPHPAAPEGARNHVSRAADAGPVERPRAPGADPVAHDSPAAPDGCTGAPQEQRGAVSIGNEVSAGGADAPLRGEAADGQEDSAPFPRARLTQCAWPLWRNDERPTAATRRCCGAQTLPGKSYCAEHLLKSRGTAGTRAPMTDAARAMRAQIGRENYEKRISGAARGVWDKTATAVRAEPAHAEASGASPTGRER